MTDLLIAGGTLLDTLPSADKLLGERANIVRRLAPLRALFGGNGYPAERRLKQVEARCSAAVRAGLLAGGGKVTEGMVDEGTRQQPEYLQALTDDLGQREQWIGLEEQLNEIEWRLRVRQTDASLLAAEARLTPGAA